MRVRGILLVVVVVMASWAWRSDVSAAETGKAAEQFVSELSNRALSIAGDASMSRDARHERYGQILDRDFDLKWISRFVLGRYWRRLSEADRTHYQTLFRDLVIHTYAQRFTSHSHYTVEVVGHGFSKQGHILVETRATDGKMTPISLDWRLVKDGDGFKVIDLVIAGISLGITQRNEYASVIRSNGGRVEVLLTEMQRQLEGLDISQVSKS